MSAPAEPARGTCTRCGEPALRYPDIGWDHDLLPDVGHPCYGLHPAIDPDLDHTLLLGRVAVIVGQQTTPAGWAVRGQQVQAVLHEAGIHTDQLDQLGAPVQSDWRYCPRCSMHPERHAGGA